jgi:gentisate 1,2-dioxygenase
MLVLFCQSPSDCPVLAVPSKEHKKANAKAQNLRPIKERETASVKSFAWKHKTASLKTKKKYRPCPAPENSHTISYICTLVILTT